MEMTVAGTAQDSHLIPFSCLGETPQHHQIVCKGSANRAKNQKKMEISFVFPRCSVLSPREKGTKIPATSKEIAGKIDIKCIITLPLAR
jgi:hypothetical protein